MTQPEPWAVHRWIWVAGDARSCQSQKGNCFQVQFPSVTHWSDAAGQNRCSLYLSSVLFCATERKSGLWTLFPSTVISLTLGVCSKTFNGWLKLGMVLSQQVLKYPWWKLTSKLAAHGKMKRLQYIKQKLCECSLHLRVSCAILITDDHELLKPNRIKLGRGGG